MLKCPKCSSPLKNSPHNKITGYNALRCTQCSALFDKKDIITNTNTSSQSFNHKDTNLYHNIINSTCDLLINNIKQSYNNQLSIIDFKRTSTPTTDIDNAKYNICILKNFDIFWFNANQWEKDLFKDYIKVNKTTLFLQVLNLNIIKDCPYKDKLMKSNHNSKIFPFFDLENLN